MEYTLSKTGQKISKITLGTVQLGMPYGINNTVGMPTYEQAAKILDTAIECGVSSFDTASAYGKSEETLGRYFDGKSEGKTIVTKVLLDESCGNDAISELFRLVELSRKKLRLEKIPILMLHREAYIERYGSRFLDALTELKCEGKVGELGVSFVDKSRLSSALDSGIFSAVQISQNIFECDEIRSGKLLQLKRDGVSVFVRSVYLQGLFFRDVDSLPPSLVPARPALALLRKLAEDEGISLSHMASGFIRDSMGVSSLVLGCETPEQLLDRCRQITAPSLSPTLREKLLEISESVDGIVRRPWDWK